MGEKQKNTPKERLTKVFGAAALQARSEADSVVLEDGSDLRPEAARLARGLVLAEFEEHESSLIDELDTEDWFMMRQVGKEVGAQRCLMHVRSELQKLSDQQKEDLEWLFIGHFKHYQRSRPTRMLLDLTEFGISLSEGNVVDQLAQSNDETLLQFLGWLDESVSREEEDEKFRRGNEVLRRSYKRRVRKAAANGVLDVSASDTISRVDEVPLYIADYITMVKKNASAFIRRTDGIYFRQGDVIRRQRSDAFHEFNHLTMDHFPSCWLDEALVEEIALHLKHDAASVKQELYLAEGVYHAERELLAMVCNDGLSEVSLTTLFHLMSCHDETRFAELEAQHEREAAAAWGSKNTLSALVRFVEIAKDRLDRTETLSEREITSRAIAMARNALYKRVDRLHRQRALSQQEADDREDEIWKEFFSVLDTV
jgi:hypothetical protein